MSAFIDIMGKRFGRLTAVGSGSNGPFGKWLFRCDCGNEKTISKQNVMQGKVRSCGCLWSENGKLAGERNRGRKQSRAERRRRSETAKRLGFGVWMKGRQPSDQTRKRISESNRGRIVSDETKTRISTANAGSKNGMWGRSHDEPTRSKIAACSREMWSKPDSKIRRYASSQQAKEHCRRIRRLAVLPVKNTRIERMVAEWLDSVGIVYRQHVFMHIPHGYQCDFLLEDSKVVIECDGDYWHKYPVGRDIDRLRTAELSAVGFRVIRLWECDILRKGRAALLDHLCEIDDYYSRLKKMEEGAKKKE